MGKKKRRADKTAPAPQPSGGGFGALLAAKGLVASEAEEPAVAAPSEAPPPEVASGKVVLRYTRKGRGGKPVTLVQGIERPSRKPLSRELSKALGCGVRVDGDDLVVQGDQRERLEPWLRNRGVTRIVVS